MENKSTYYVYTHLNPATKEVFYVGVGHKHRVIEGGRHRNKKWLEYVYRNNGFLFEKLVENIPKADALKIERDLIQSIGLDNLTNIVGEFGNSTAFKKGQTPWNKGLIGLESCSYKRVEYNNEIYDSIKDLISHLKIGRTTFYRRIKKGTLIIKHLDK